MYDAIVIGGGPGGATSATLLAQSGHRVLLLEKQKFPRFQIGESLLPYNNPLFERLGVESLLSSEEFHPKFGAHFVTGDGKVGHIFRFDRTLGKPYSRSIQVERAKFDEALLRNAAAKGVTVSEETTVLDVDLSRADRATVRVRERDGRESYRTARFVIDASGACGLLGNRMNGRVDAPDLKKVSFFAHYRGVAPSAEGRNRGNTVIVILRNAWVWMIPVARDVMSVGVVVDGDAYRRSGLTPEALLEKTLQNADYIRERMDGARRITDVMARKDFSFRMKSLAGPNYALVGDAAGFIDPIFSTGVFMAMKSGEMAAAAVTERLATGSMRALRTYEHRMGAALDKYLKFIRCFYRREFLEIFLQPRGRFGLRQAVVGVLAGNVFEPPRDRLKLALFFGLVWLQKMRRNVAPPIGWDTLPEMAHA